MTYILYSHYLYLSFSDVKVSGARQQILKSRKKRSVGLFINPVQTEHNRRLLLHALKARRTGDIIAVRVNWTNMKTSVLVTEKSDFIDIDKESDIKNKK